jgi:antitoxin component of RelBE/YafQ-DinJ toxin-antitoxin module
MSNSTTLTIRLDGDIKEAARARAQRIGISLSTLVENDLRRFINGHPVIIDDDSFVPTERLKADIAAARADHASGDYDVVGLDNLDEYLDGLSESAK